MNNDSIKAYHAAHDNRPAEGYEVPAVMAEHVSDLSLEVLQHFGMEAPKLLNDYACAVEDALIEQVKRANQAEDFNRVVGAVLEANGIDLRDLLEKAKEKAEKEQFASAQDQRDCFTLA